MNNTIFTQANPIIESYSTLMQLANLDNTSSTLHTLRSKTASHPDKQAMASKILQYFDTVEPLLDFPLDRLHYFFKLYNQENNSDCHAELFLTQCLEATDLHAFAAQVRAFTKEERFSHVRIVIARMLSQTPEVLMETDRLLTSEAQVVEAIFKTDCLDEKQKYEAFYLYYHYEDLLEEFIHLITTTASVIMPYLEPFYEDISALIQEVQPALDTQGTAYFKELIHIDLGTDTCFHFYPCITSPLTLSFTNIHTRIDAFNVLMGIYVLPFMRAGKAQQKSEKEMSNFLKALADPSKLQILKLLKDERLYASELAEKLGISNATISHHMNALLQLEILNFEKEHNKFYYSLQKDQFKTYIDSLTKLFDL